MNPIYDFSSVEHLPTDILTLIRMYVGDRKFAIPTERCPCEDCHPSHNKCCTCKFALENALINTTIYGPKENYMKAFEEWQKCRCCYRHGCL